MQLAGILAIAGDKDQGTVHRCLQDVDQGYASIDKTHRFPQGERHRMGMFAAETVDAGLGGKGMLDTDVQPLGGVETLLQCGIVAGELGLGAPLGRKDERRPRIPPRRGLPRGGKAGRKEQRKCGKQREEPIHGSVFPAQK